MVEKVKMDENLTISQHRAMAAKIRRARTLVAKIYNDVSDAYCHVDNPAFEDKPFLEAVENVRYMAGQLDELGKCLDRRAQFEHVWAPIYEWQDIPFLANNEE